MRCARIKPDDRPIFYHLYNRVAGDPDFLPFGPMEKEHFVRLLHKLDQFYTVKVVAYQVMSNHFHLVVHAPEKPPAAEEVSQRYKRYYKGRRKLDISDPRCEEYGRRMRDISWYMQALQQQFTRWYNRTRPRRRRGGLWADRFKHTLLGDSRAVWECCRYVEMNAVRAGLVSDPCDYRYSSYGAWCGTGKHPFEANIHEVLLPALGEVSSAEGAARYKQLMKESFAGVLGVDSGDCKRDFVVALDRRVRYWVDGLVIGSELFVWEMVARSRGVLRKGKRGFIQASNVDQSPELLWCCKWLRPA